jgi:hypothetical protein
MAKQTRAEFTQRFTEVWTAEIRDAVERGEVERATDYWYDVIQAQVDDEDLPKSAHRWKPPAWLKRLNEKAARTYRLGPYWSG